MHSGRVVENLRFRDSKKDVLIQMANMIAGAIKRKYTIDKSDYKDYFNKISQKIEDIWDFK
jgi:hypothetical protein